MNACKGCKDRWVDAKSGKTCHSTCEIYKAFIEQNEKRKKQIEIAVICQNHIVKRKNINQICNQSDILTKNAERENECIYAMRKH